jgi:hypothetical protein
VGNINCNNHKIKIKSFKDLEHKIAKLEEKKIKITEGTNDIKKYFVHLELYI